MIPCRICSSKDSRLFFRKDGLGILQCNSCGLKFTDAEPGRESLKEFYGEKYFRSEGAGTTFFDYFSEESAMALNAARRLDKIEMFKSSAKDRRLLDVGCATGFFLKNASQRWLTCGVELSEFASSYAREKFGLDVKTGTLKDVSFPGKDFDVVTMWDVVEHLAAPLDDLVEVNRVMKDDGLLVLTTGDASSLFARLCRSCWHLYNPTQHLSFFSAKTVGLLLDKAGFRIIKIEHDGNSFTLGYITSSLAMYYPFFATRFLHRIIKKTFLKNIKIYLNLKDIMTIYAVKTSPSPSFR